MSQLDFDNQLLERLDSASFGEKISIYARMMGPAWLGVALNIGGATFVTGSVLGASTGTDYLWVVTLAVIGSWIMMMGTMKLMVTNPEPMIQTIKKHIHPTVAALIAGATILVNEIFHTTQVYLSAVWLNTSFGYGLDVWIIATVIIVSLLVFPGQSRRYEAIIENVMKVVIMLLVLALVIDVFYIPVNWGSVVTGLVAPKIPNSPSQILLVTGVIGAGFVITVPMVSSYGWRAREWDVRFLDFGRWEVHISQALFLVVNWLVIIVFAFTLHSIGKVPSSPIGGALALKPFLGQFAFVLFGFGLWAAVISSVTMQVTLTGYLIADIMGWDIDPSKRRWKIAAALTFIPGIIVPFIGVSPFQWTVYGSAFNASFTFVFVLVLLYLLRSEDVMGKHRVSGRLYWGLIYSILFAAIAFAQYLASNV